MSDHLEDLSSFIALGTLAWQRGLCKYLPTMKLDLATLVASGHTVWLVFGINTVWVQKHLQSNMVELMTTCTL